MQIQQSPLIYIFNLKNANSFKYMYLWITITDI